MLKGWLASLNVSASGSEENPGQILSLGAPRRSTINATCPSVPTCKKTKKKKTKKRPWYVGIVKHIFRPPKRETHTEKKLIRIQQPARALCWLA